QSAIGHNDRSIAVEAAKTDERDEGDGDYSRRRDYGNPLSWVARIGSGPRIHLPSARGRRPRTAKKLSGIVGRPLCRPQQGKPVEFVRRQRSTRARPTRVVVRPAVHIEAWIPPINR